MSNISKLFLIFAVIFMPTFGYCQTLDDTEVLSRMVNLSKQVHFSDTEGKDLVVPSGPYWVIPEENSLLLFGLLDGQSYDVAATKEEKAEAISMPTAVSIPGSDEESDAHYVVYMSVEGEQLVAKGSYSGVRSRGILTDRAKKKVAAATQAAVKQALIVKGKVQKAADDLRQKVQQAAEVRRRKALADVGKMLQDIANTEAREGQDQALKKAALYAPRLTVLSVVAIPMQDRVRYITEAKRQIQIHGDFIKEVARRMSKIKPFLKDGKRKFSNADIQIIGDTIWGSGDNELRHPFAGPTVKSRGVGGGIDPSWSIGGSLGVGLIAGVSVGDSFAMPMSRPWLRTCNYASASWEVGALEKAAASGGISFYSGSYRELGASSLDTWSAGPEIAVNLGVAVGPGVQVIVLFGLPSAGTFINLPTGLQFGISGGEKVEASVGLSYGIQLFCAQQNDH